MAENVIVDLYNAPSFKNPSPPYTLCNTVGCLPIPCNKNSPCRSNNPGSPPLLPGEERQIKVYLKSPSESDIAGIKTDTSLDYKVDYGFEAAFVYIVPVVNLEEIIKRQRANERADVIFSKSHSSGPIKIDAELIGAKYILANQPAVLSFKIKNIGSGTLQDSKIEETLIGPVLTRIPTGLSIRFPKGLVNNINDIKEKPENFECTELADEFRCYNTQDIEIFKDESRTSIRFKINPPLPQDVPLRSYTIVATAGYTYELRNSVKVTVNPFQNVG